MVIALLLESHTDVAFEMRYVVGYKVRQLGVFRIAPARLNGIEFGSVCGQPLEVDAFKPRGPDPLSRRAVDLPSVPADDQRSLQLLAELPDKADDLVRTNIVFMDLEGCAYPPSYGREGNGANDAQTVVPVPGPLNGRFTSRGPGATVHRLQAEACFIDKNYARPTVARFFLMRGQSLLRHCSTAWASCSLATRRGFWGENPRSCSTRRMWAGWYETPNFLRTTRETRLQLHKSVRNPKATGPMRSILISDCLCSSESLRSGPGCGLAAKPSTPSAFHVRFQRFTLVKLTQNSDAISRRGFRSWKYSAARRRRASSSAALPGGLMEHSTVLAPPRVH
jgi:hypothetical protein